VLRLIFVLAIVLVGIAYAFQGPFYILLFYLWNAYFRPEQWVWNDLIWSLRLSFVIGLFLVVTALPSLRDFRLTALVGLMLLFLSQTVISVWSSSYVDLIWPFWMEFLKVIIVSVLITVLVNTVARFRLALVVIALSLGFEAAKQGWVELIRNPGATNRNAHPVLGDNNGVALGMMMLIPILMALAQTAKGRWERYLHRFLTVGVVYRGVSTYSRGGFLAATVVFILTLWRSNHKIKTLFLTALVAALIYSALPPEFWARMDTIVVSDDEERDSSAQSRLYFWSLGARMAADYPWTGVGVNGFRYAFAQYDADMRFGDQRAVHSIWYGLMSEVGYPGFAFFILIVLMALFACQRSRWRARRLEARDLALYAAHLQTSVVVFVVAGSFLSVQYSELFWHIIALVAALDRITARMVAERDAAVPARAIPSSAALPARLPHAVARRSH
jgi:probable O-glycosylation ligase (exosortase A-associated)